jgi:tRNA threonylcarbamoyladenosine biosynthesis protein TsaE
MKLEIISNSAIETKVAAKAFAKIITVPSVVSLVGNLGAGKTTLTQGFGEAFGIKDFITSPTFTILNEYKQGDINLYHFDMYRLESYEEAAETGFLEYFDLKTLDGITIVEWASNTQEILPEKYYQITLERIDDEKRKIIFETVEKK